MHSFQDAYKFLLYCRLGQVERLTIEFMKVSKISLTLKADHNPPSSPRRIVIRREHFRGQGLGRNPLMRLHPLSHDFTARNVTGSN